MPKFIFARGLQKGGEVACADPGIFVRGGGVQISLTKKALTVFFCFFFRPRLILQKSNGQFQRIYHFSRFQRGPTFSRGGGGSNFFQGGGVQLLIPHRNPYNL